MKKLISIFLVLGVLGSALVGCGAKEGEGDAAAPATTAGAPAATEEGK